MADHQTLYRLIQQRAEAVADGYCLQQVMQGLSWSYVALNPVDQLSSGPGLGLSMAPAQVGLCFSASQAPRNLPWPGKLSGRKAVEILPWLQGWNPCETVISLATANALLQIDSPALAASSPITAHIERAIPGNLAVFAHFAPQLQDANVVVIGRYPGMKVFADQFSYHCIEQNPNDGELPAAAAAEYLPAADWVFLTASSLANKTLPTLLSYCRNANTVLLGPSLPWLQEWADFGVDYLAGVVVEDFPQLQTIVAEGGGTGIFEQAVSYRVVKFS
ncbi:Rossmann-like domain-containing protein [Oceanobacter mangrovi]|uniref:Rossmann-like domain-containing protein n=1 Tax=Oceanobacter mangrovi TaxID=2862510 RepID=UPI001C8F08ED|nr:DUF364 domain-containing protein [Oceanobacter mangrovi]